MQSLFPHQPWPVIPTPDRRKILTRSDASAPYTSQDTPQPIMRYNPSLLCTDTARSQVSIPCDDGAAVGVTFSDPASQSPPCLRACSLAPPIRIDPAAALGTVFKPFGEALGLQETCRTSVFPRRYLFELLQLWPSTAGHLHHLPDFERETSHPHRQQEGFLS